MELGRLRAEMRELQDANAALGEDVRKAQMELAVIRSGIGWRVLEANRRLRQRAAPAGTRRDRALRALLTGADACVRLGVLRTLRILLLRPRGLLPALRAARSDARLMNRQYQLWLEQHRPTATRLEMIREEIR